MTFFETAATWLGEKLQAVAGRTVEYYRGAEHFPITAIPSLVNYQFTDGDGVPQEIQSQDYTFIVAELVEQLELLAAETNPLEGDRIVDTIAGEEVTFQVVPVANKPHFEWQEAGNRLVRVHSLRY